MDNDLQELTKETEKIRTENSTVTTSVSLLDICTKEVLILRKEAAAVRVIPIPYYS